jgi:hypothetical protein
MQFLFLIGPFLKKYFPLKLLCQMNQNLVGSIYGRSSIEIANLVVFVWPLLILLIHYVPSVADILTPWSYKANVNYNKYF